MTDQPLSEPTTEPEPLSNEIVATSYNVYVLDQHTVISKEETDEIAKGIVAFAEWAGFDKYLRHICHILVLYLRIHDLDQIGELVGCKRVFVDQVMTRAQKYKIFEAIKWFDKDEGDMGLMMDTMVVAGVFERREKEGDYEYRIAPLRVNKTYIWLRFWLVDRSRET